MPFPVPVCPAAHQTFGKSVGDGLLSADPGREGRASRETDRQGKHLPNEVVSVSQVKSGTALSASASARRERVSYLSRSEVGPTARRGRGEEKFSPDPTDRQNLRSTRRISPGTYSVVRRLPRPA